MTTLRIFEDATTPGRSRRAAETLEITRRESASARAGLDLETLEGSLLRVSEPDRVRHVRVSPHSRLTRLPDLRRFRNVESVDVLNAKVRDHSSLRELRSLRSLYLTKYPHTTLDEFAKRSFESVKLWNARVESITLDARFLFVQRCRSLRRFDSLRAQSVLVEGCPRLELETLGGVEGLASLTLHVAGAIDLGWIGSCAQLRHLVIERSPKGAIVDTTPLARVTSLRRVFLGVGDAEIERLGRSAPWLCVTNGRMCYLDGARRSDASAYYATAEPPPAGSHFVPALPPPPCGYGGGSDPSARE